MKKIFSLIFLMSMFALPAFGQGVYPSIDSNPVTFTNKDVSSATNKFGIITGTVPITVGSSLYPIYQNQTSITITTTSDLNTFTCVTNCGNLYVGALVNQSLAFPNNTTVTGIVGTAITGTANASTTQSTAVTASVGYNKFDATSVAIFNNVASKQGYFGQASQNNSNWTDQYLPTYCVLDAFCSLNLSGSSSGALFGLRTSENTGSTSVASLNSVILSVNDNTSTSHELWSQYIQTEVLLGASATSLNLSTEEDIAGQNTAVQANPFGVNVQSGLYGHRVGCGNGLSAQTSCTVAYDVVNNGAKFFTGINFGATALDTTLLTHPPAIALASGTNGQAITWQWETGYSNLAWSIYSTSTSVLANSLVLSDSAATFSTPIVVTGETIAATNPIITMNQSGAGTNLGLWTFSVGSGTFLLETNNDNGTAGTGILSVARGTTTNITSMTFGNGTSNPTYTFAGTGGITTTGSVGGGGFSVSSSSLGTAPRIYLPAAGTLGIGANSVEAAGFTSTSDTLFNAVLMPNIASSSAATTGTVCWTTSTGNLTVDTTNFNCRGSPTAISIPTGTATFAGGTGITSVVCASGYSCNNTRGTLTIVGGTATTGTIATVTFSASLGTAPFCVATMNGGATLFSIGNSAPTATAFNITAGISVIGATFNVNYVCQP